MRINLFGMPMGKKYIIMDTKQQTLFKNITTKALLKQQVGHCTRDAFISLKNRAKSLADTYVQAAEKAEDKVPFVYKDRGGFEFEIQFGGDTLVFLLHSNVYEIPRDHSIMRKSYVKDDKDRRFCGMISIYNFLSDSFTYQRHNDGGFMIGRLMINKDSHYFIEGKKEIAMIHHQFETAIMNVEAMDNILCSAIEYTLNFDVLIPPYDKVAFVAVGDIQENMQKGIATNKRMGFKFGEDKLARDEAK